jgi:hypothetical protein
MGGSGSKETSIVTIRATQRGMMGLNLPLHVPDKLNVTCHEVICEDRLLK